MIARVILDISTAQTDKFFDYSVPEGMQLHAGDRVLVPFGSKMREGFCIALTDKSDCDTLKEIASCPDNFTAITPEMLGLVEFMKDRFFLRYADGLRLCLPSALRGGRIHECVRYYMELNPARSADEWIADIPERARVKRAVVERLRAGGEFLSTLASEFSAATITAMLDAGILIKSEKQVYRKPFGQCDAELPRVQLTPMQQHACDGIFDAPTTTVLLHGVTGSGKTMVYMHAIERVLAEGKSAIMLVPEISLTPQMLRNFRAYFGDTVAMLHSGLSDGERLDEWLRLLRGQARIVVGARSAIFAPLDNVGIIVIDEEHDSSYTSESNPRYRTVDVAQWRADYHGAKVVLGSATPSVESYLAAKNKQYTLLELPERISSRGMPQMQIVDMSHEILRGNNGIFSAALAQALQQTIARGEQAMVFLNRRGHSSFVMCRKCGYIAKCEDCDVALTYHSVDEQLKCHFCGKRYKMLTACPECGSKEIRYGKIGTQRVVEEIQKLLPDVSVLRMDNETTTTKTAYLDILGAFAAKEAQILVGTQMIAKGHDFPDVTLVGILDADMSLYHSDYRSNEKTFQLVTQVAGRAGRSVKAGQVILQTYSPNHFVYRFARSYDYKGFYDKEINVRMTTNFPPFSTIVRILMSAESEDKVIAVAKELYADVRAYAIAERERFYYVQAMKSPVQRIQNKYRYQVLMRIRRSDEDNTIRDLYAIADRHSRKGVTVFAEVNPQNLS